MTTREMVLLGALLIILAVAILPMFRKGKQQAASVAAMNNLMQWGIGLNLYLLDHDNRLPLAGPSQPRADLSDAWYNALPPYLSQAPWSSLVSPTFKRDDPSAAIWNDPVMREKFGEMKDIFIFPYGMNRYLQPQPDQPSFRVFDLENPQSVVFLSEAASVDPGLVPGAVSYRHSRKPLAPGAVGHVLIVDGHAAAVERRILSAEPGSEPPAEEKSPAVSWLPYADAPVPVVE